MGNTTKTLLTIGLPFFNNEKTLANAIKSILLQTYTQWELILVDDGSTDGSYQIAKKFTEYDQRIKLTSDGQNRGLVYRLNQIIDLAQTKYIARMDSDDMMMPEKLEKQMKAFFLDERIDVIDTAVYTINEKDEPIGLRETEDINKSTKKKILTQALLFHATIIAKKSWYDVNRYNADFLRSEDFELWCRTFDKTTFYRISEPLFIYREGNVNLQNYLASNRTHRKILLAYSPGILSKAELLKALAITHLKSTLYRAFAFFDKQYILTSKRNLKLTPSQAAKVKSTVERINQWQL